MVPDIPVFNDTANTKQQLNMAGALNVGSWSNVHMPRASVRLKTVSVLSSFRALNSLALRKDTMLVNSWRSMDPFKQLMIMMV